MQLIEYKKIKELEDVVLLDNISLNIESIRDIIKHGQYNLNYKIEIEKENNDLKKKIKKDLENNCNIKKQKNKKMIIIILQREKTWLSN